MKIDNIDYVQSITKKMTLNLSNVIKVQSYTLDELTTSIQNLKKDEKEKILENIINNQLVELKDIPEETIISVFKQVDEITDYFIKFYDDNSDIVSECDDIANDLLFKSLGKNNRKLELPINLTYIKNYCLSSSIKDNQIYDSLVWITLRLVAILYCIRFNYDLIKDKNEEQ